MPGHVPTGGVHLPPVIHPGQLAVCQDMSVMDSARFLMMVGLLLVIGLLLWELVLHNIEVAKETKKIKARQNSDGGVCPIHKGDPDKCRDSHSSDSPSQEPPTDESGATDGHGESAAAPDDE